MTERKELIRAIDDLSADQIMSQREELLSWLKCDQVFSQYVRSCVSDNGRGAPVTEPWMALGEQRARAFILLHDVQLDSVGGEALTPLGRLLLGKALLNSQTYMWQHEILTTALECPMPKHVISRDVLPHPEGMYFSFEHAVEVKFMRATSATALLKKEVTEVECDGIQLLATKDGFSFIDHGASNAAGQPMVLSSHVPYGVTFPDDFDEVARRQVGDVLAMMSFLKSRYTSNTEHKLPRAWRRHQQMHRADRDRLIRVVAMRKAASVAVTKHHAASDTASDTSSKSRVRWWVSGHHRAQWYPSKQSHEVVWIAPYLKGPSDAPMLKKVYAVSR
jgi:hypothetical protein